MDMQKKILTGSGVLLALLLFLAINILGNTLFTSVRIDLTENRLYTLSDGTRNILSGLAEPLSLQLFLSESAVTRLPGISSYALRVKEFLEEYSRFAGSNLQVQIIDPEPFSEDEDRAVGYGLQGVPLDDSGTSLYFGLVGSNSIDDEEIIPFFPMDRQEYLEYDLTKLIYQLSSPRKPKIGLLSDLPLAGAPGAPPYGQAMPAWTIYNQISQFFNIETLEPGLRSIPQDIDVLMLVHPKNLTAGTLYAIDQYVLGGGRALVFVDPYSEADPQTVSNWFKSDSLFAGKPIAGAAWGSASE